MLDAFNFLLKSRKFWKLVFELLAAERDLQLGEIRRDVAEDRSVKAIKDYFDSRNHI
jgi:hypothetical protein